MNPRLAQSLSPYLRQHADNPVDWYPWGPEALAAARDSGKPILLSIGYSACHWCHVMAHESFEDPATAAVMNALFVNVKVDREERPDLDRLYQLAHQLLTRRGGGWPLTMFLTHDDQRPFFGGTYFPPEARFGLPAFRDLLQRVAQFYREQQPALRAQNDELVAALARIEYAGPRGDAPQPEAVRQTRRELEARFDRDHGGFSGAPKFPQPAALLRLLHAWHASATTEAPDLKALFMATFTLHRMAEGGLADQLGGGFFRYCVDAAWTIPHFEKMLGDNALLLGLYAEAWTATGEPLYGEVVAATAAFLQRELRAQGGGYYTALDADAGGAEGRYYVWSRAEIEAALGPDAVLFAARHGLDEAPNFEGRWHLRLARSVESLAAEAGGADALPQLQARLAGARAVLLELRAHRPPPGRDDKVLTAWNALAIRALARAARALDRNDLQAAALEALGFLRTTLWRNGRLHAAWHDGQLGRRAFLDDHVFLAAAACELLELRFDADLLAFATQLMDAVLARFAAPDGGFHFTADDDEPLIHRSLGFADDATPSGNAVAAEVLLRLGHLLGEPRYLAAAEGVLHAAGRALAEQPLAHLSLIEALDESLTPRRVVILRGTPARLAAWQAQLRRHYLPRTSVYAIPHDATDLPPALALREARGDIVAWVCRGGTCLPPLSSIEALAGVLELLPEGQH
jgi:uncharacterized protein YyaL (SSP411 family)